MPAFARFASHTLALCIALTSGAVYALEAISDADLSSSTGEGIAILPENFSFIMADEDASYINIIPRGAPKTAGITRADIYIRNLSITQNDSSLTRASGTNIVSWGTGANPFLIAVKSESHPDYAAANQTRAFLRIEAPNYCFTGVTAAAGSDCPTLDTGTAAVSAYNLRLGAQVDLLIKTNSQAQGYGATVGNALSGANGIGLQAIWNGMSLNGTKLDIFQTPSNSSDSSYNSTLGLRALIRLNTDSAQTNNGLRLTTALDTAYNGTTNRLFDGSEGIRIQDLDINLPLGIPHYQSLVLGKAADNSGNFYLELTRLPNDSDAYNAAYIDYSNAAMVTAKTCTSTSCGTTAVPATHGTISMGATTFTSKANVAVNVGTSKIDGLFIQHLKLTTTGL
jgi:hypothetical protein